MKTLNHTGFLGMLVLGVILFNGCDKVLNEPVYSQLDPDKFLSTENGITSTLANAYTKASNMNGNTVYQAIAPEMFTTGDYYQTGGGDNTPSTILLNFIWDAGNPAPTFVYANWNSMWKAIRNANVVMENVDRVSDQTNSWKKEIKSEARFIRAYAYYKLWNQYGAMVIRKSTEGALALPRASSKEFSDFMESELKDIIPSLPEPGHELAYGRADRGAARALLTLWYLNTYQWQKCADMAGTIIDSGHYHLYPDYNAMFDINNERNSEFIWVQPALANQGGAHNAFLAVVLPPGFKKTVNFKYPFTFGEWANYASQFRLRDKFVNSFEPDDERDDRILKEYINASGDTVNLMKGHTDDARGIKFPPDNTAHGDLHGNDFPFIRYAAIILARAEALNDLQGPNPESIKLINEIRDRAGLTGIKLNDYTTKDELNAEILEERGHEFWLEGKRRRDLIRMGKFIEFAHDRGISVAAPRDTLFPIPQSAMDANPKLIQNPGY